MRMDRKTKREDYLHIYNFYKYTNNVHEVTSLDLKHVCFLPMELLGVFSQLKKKYENYSKKELENIQKIILKILDKHYEELHNENALQHFASEELRKIRLYSNGDFFSVFQHFYFENKELICNGRTIISKDDGIWKDIFSYICLVYLCSYITVYHMILYPKNNDNLSMADMCNEIVTKLKTVNKIHTPIKYFKFLQTASLNIMVPFYTSFIRESDKAAFKQLSEQIEKNKNIASETGRAAVKEGVWKHRDNHLEYLKPEIKKLADKGRKHHEIADILSKNSELCSYNTSRGLTKKLNKNEIMNFVKTHFIDTNRKHLVHGLQEK